MNEFVKLSGEVSDEMRAKIKETAEECGLPEKGVLVLVATQQAIDDGSINADELLSGQDMITAIADRLDDVSNDPEAISDLADKLRLISVYATTHLIPVSKP